jgi:protein-tyrosine phosphatase
MSEPRAKIPRPAPINIDLAKLEKDREAELAAKLAAQKAYERELAEKPWSVVSPDFLKYGNQYDEILAVIEEAQKTMAKLPDFIAELCGKHILLCGVGDLNVMHLELSDSERPPYDRRIQVLSDGEFVSFLDEGYEARFGISVHKFAIEDSHLQDIRPVLDETRQIFKAIRDTAAGDTVKFGKTLIHCYAGQNRGAVVAAVAIMTLTGCGLRDAIREIVHARPLVLHNYSFLRQLVMWAVDHDQF